MKKSNIRFFAVAVVLLAATSCQKEEIRTLKATFERFENESKAYIDDDYYSCWEANDAVVINGTSCAVTLASGCAQARSAQIVVPAELNGQNLLAVYPADKISDMTASGGTVNFPHIQTYMENTDGKQIIDNPMAAYCASDGTELKFHNLGSLLKVTIPNNEDIKAIQVKGIDNQMLCGKAQIKFDNNGNPMLTSCTNGSNSVTLRFPSPVTANGKSFYIVLPPNTNFETLTIAVLANNGTSWAHHAKTADMGRVLARNHIAAFSYDISHHTDYDFVADWTMRYTASCQVEIETSYMEDHIAYHNFSGTKGLVVFEDIITKVSDYTYFGEDYLQSITIPASVTEIGASAFQDCNGLTSVSAPCATIIGNSAFFACHELSSVSVPCVTAIGFAAFAACTNLSHIYSRTGLPTIGTNVFDNVPSSAVLHLPSSLSGATWPGWPGTYDYDYNN